MDDSDSLILTPVRGESLAQYLQRYTDERLQRIFSNPELLRRFCAILLKKEFQEFERKEDGLENLWRIIERLNNLDNILYFVHRLEPVRSQLLETLERSEGELRKMSTLCSVGRLVGSAVDITGTVFGLLMRDSNPGYANLAFRAATSFGILGFVSTLSEMNNKRSTIDEIMKLIKKDEELFGPIQRWYQQSNELEAAMQAIFPFDVTNQMVSEFSEVCNTEEIAPERLLAALIKSIADQDFSRIRDAGLLFNLINFTSHPGSQDWMEWVIIRRHPVILDITRMILQLQSSPLRFVLGQSVPALAIADQNIQSFPVWGRIGLNLLTIMDSVRSLQRSDAPCIASEMRHLRRHYQSELAALQRIADFITVRRNRRDSPTKLPQKKTDKPDDDPNGL